MSPELPVDATSDEAADAHRRLLLIALRESVVAVPADAVVEVLPARPYATLPGADRAVAGIVNRRGRILTVVDLGLALGQPPSTDDADHRVVVVAWRQRELGLAVKDVLQITTAWWTDSPDEAVGEVEEDGGAGPVAPSRDPEVDQQLEVVELDVVLAPLFGGDEEDADVNETGRP